MCKPHDLPFYLSYDHHFIIEQIAVVIGVIPKSDSCTKCVG